MLHKIKILVIGPCKSGKTAISNFLSDAIEISNQDYRPTQGVRIVEFEVQLKNQNGTTVDIELWDCSGDPKFSSCWPAMSQDSSGVLFVYNPDESAHSANMDQFFEHFAQKPNLRDIQCLVLANHRPNTPHSERCQLSSKFLKVTSVSVDLNERGEQLRTDFVKFVSRLYNAIHDKREQQELDLIS